MAKVVGFELSKEPGMCPACGAEVPPKALACPACGADEKTGWNQEAAIYNGLDLPESPDATIKPPKRAINGIAWYWWLLAVILLVWLAYDCLTGQFYITD